MQWLPWQDAAWAATGSAAATRALGRRPARPVRAVAAWTRELAVMFVLYGLWQLAGSQSLAQVGGAVARGAAVARWERGLPVPGEAQVQHLVLGDWWVLRLFNVYYVGLHVVITGLCLVWVFARHRDRYPAVRNVLAVVTGVCLLVALIPVAPPRLVPGLGLVDTGRLVGPTVYPATARPGLDQLSAMPSVHVAWALVVAWSVVHVMRSRWRWLAAAYPVATLFIVIATGNHYWADGLASGAICAAVFAGAWAWGRYRPARAVPAADGPAADGPAADGPATDGSPRPVATGG